MSNRRSLTLVEAIFASVILTILFASCLGAFGLIKNINRYGIASQNLQRDINRIAAKIIRGTEEGTELFGLRSAASFTLPDAVPAGSAIDYVGMDGNTRQYFLNSGSIIYASPTQNPNQRTVYTVPADTNLVLRFWEPAGYTDHETVGIYISLSQVVGNKTVSGSLSTYVNLRNMPK